MQARQPASRTLPSTDASERLDELIDDIAKGGEEIIVESRGKKVAVISYDEFVDYRNERQQKRRDEAMRRLRSLEERIGDRNADLSDEEIEELADRAVREAIDDLAAEGKLVFERDQQ